MSVLSPRAVQKAGQYTALVDILFATIGIFVIVFALQELEPKVDLVPAPYDKVLICGADRVLRLHEKDAVDPLSFGPREIASELRERLQLGGRVLVGLSAECMIDAGDGVVLVDRLRDMERQLTERGADAASSLLLIEFAPLAKDGEADLLERFGAPPEDS